MKRKRQQAASRFNDLHGYVIKGGDPEIVKKVTGALSYPYKMTPENRRMIETMKADGTIRYIDNQDTGKDTP